MGINCSHDTDKAAVAAREIDAQLRKDSKQRMMKLLLLGAGESGKSTVRALICVFFVNQNYTASAGVSMCD